MWLLTKTQTLLLILVSLSLALQACGFRLRGSVDLPKSMATVYIEGVAEYSESALAIRNSFISAGSQVVKEQKAALTRLVITQDTFDRRVLSVDARGQPNEYELKYQLGFKVLDSGGVELLPQQTISKLRAYQFDPNNVLTKGDEEARIKKEMLRANVAQLMRRISIGMKKRQSLENATPPAADENALDTKP